MLLYECRSDAKKILNRSMSETRFLSEASSSCKVMTLFTCACASPLSFSFNSLSCCLSSTPTTMDHFSNMFRRTLKYSSAVVLCQMHMNRVLGNVDAMVCRARASFSIHLAKSFLYFSTSAISARLVAIHAGDLLSAGLIGNGFVPWR